LGSESFALTLCSLEIFLTMFHVSAYNTSLPTQFVSQKGYIFFAKRDSI